MYKAKFEWPNGAHIAVVFNMSWEIPPHDLGALPKAKYKRAMRPVYENAFADTGGMQRLLDLWQRHDIRGSCYADGLGVTLFPELSREMAAHGHEFIVQGWDHGFLYDLTVAEQADAIKRTNDVFERILGKRATGFSSAGGHLTAETFSILAEQGFKYSCGLRNAEVPFIIRVGDKKLVGMTSYAVSDTPTARGMSPREVVTMWRDYFDALYDEGRRGYPKMLAYGTHPVLSHGHRTRPLEEVIGYVKSRGNVWITTRGEIADWMLQKYPEYDLSAFYPEAANSDRNYGLGIGLGGEEARKVAYDFREG
ncbi:MAG TPA: polysaccharide deacetylase family protein [Beijerinckiaceae bacterium]|jgi:peptidoglycan/xylan/chitin deacetylase (PgdA/CDA1 family)|nr:polysaccharide deacetylase family protein [Beijerinckiaceae bacterium]